MTTAPLDVEKCRRLIIDGKRSGTGDLSPELADQLRAALTLLAEARDALDAIREYQCGPAGDSVTKNMAAEAIARIPECRLVKP